MSLTTVYAKSLRDRWVGTTVGMGLVSVLLVLAMLAYDAIGTELYTDLPEALRSVMGIPAGADASALAYAVVFGMVAALTLGGLAVSMGAAGIAGEERTGSIAVLLGNPRSRRQVLLSKLGGTVSLVVVGGLVLLAAGLVAPSVLGTALGETRVAAATLHLVANSLLFGAVAAAVGAVTGKRSLASAVAGGTMVLSYLLAGLLPLFAWSADAVRAVPWFWYDGHDPLNHGVDAGYLGLQLGVTAALVAVAWWGVEARDLTSPTATQGLVAGLADRIRTDERAARLLDRLEGSANVSSIFARSAVQGQALLVVVAGVMFSMMGLMMGPMYAALADTLLTMSTTLPEAMVAFVGGGDMTTAEGWYRLETFGLMAPIAVILVGGAAGTRALAGEERDRTLGLLLASPVRRRTVVLEKAAAMALHVALVALATFAGVVGGSALGGLGMSTARIAAACLHLTLLGVLFGTVALAIGAATGRVRSATMGTAAIAVVAYFANSILSISDSFAGWQRLTPFEWYLGGSPLVHGVEWSSVGLFLACSAVLLAAAVALFERRDLRTA